MKIEVAEPPIMDAIDAVFHNRGQKILYAFGDTIYNPAGIPVPDFLMMHEITHVVRQTVVGGAEAWWKKYLEDEEFRYLEELAGHRAEFQTQAKRIRDRNARERLLMLTASRLVAPLYKYSNKKLLEAKRALVAQQPVDLWVPRLFPVGDLASPQP